MPPHQPTPTPLGLSVKDAAALTSFSEWEIRRAIDAGEIPARRRGKRIAIDYAGLVEWFNSHAPVIDHSA